MSTILDVNRRPLPSFKEWIEQQSPGTHATGFEALADLAYRSQAQAHDHLQPQEQSFGRMWVGAVVAAVELCNMEALKHGRSSEEIIATLPRVFAAAAMYAIASACKPETPHRRIAKLITEEFRAGAKAAADQLFEQQQGDDQAGAGDAPDLGPCCNCGTTVGVTNMVMLHRRAPVPGTGWGCMICRLPADGAVAVLCDGCLGQEVKAVCLGYPKEGRRTPVKSLAPEAFDHDPTVDHDQVGAA